jgi:hypothetical protein
MSLHSILILSAHLANVFLQLAQPTVYAIQSTFPALLSLLPLFFTVINKAIMVYLCNVAAISIKRVQRTIYSVSHFIAMENKSNR